MLERTCLLMLYFAVKEKSWVKLPREIAFWSSCEAVDQLTVSTTASNIMVGQPCSSLLVMYLYVTVKEVR